MPQPCACYCVLKRPSGLLLCLPRLAISQEALGSAAAAGHTGVLGPASVVSVQAVLLELDPAKKEHFRPNGRFRSRRLSRSNALCHRSGSPPFRCWRAFDVPSNHKGVLLCSRLAPGHRWGQRYAAAADAEEVPAPGLERPTAKAEAKSKRPIVAGLASQQAMLQDLVASLARQVQEIAVFFGLPFLFNPMKGSRPLIPSFFLLGSCRESALRCVRAVGAFLLRRAVCCALCVWLSIFCSLMASLSLFGSLRRPPESVLGWLEGLIGRVADNPLSSRFWEARPSSPRSP